MDAHPGNAISYGSERLAFADILRGAAAFVVMLGHFTFLFLTAPSIVAPLINADPIEAWNVPQWIVSLYNLVDLAAIGVAVFFLISGFVIPLSLERASFSGFVVRRFLRIYPTYWVALALNIGALFLSAAYWDKPVQFTVGDYVANVLLTTELSQRHFDIPSVMWTLQIEIKFYLVAPLFFVLIDRGKAAALLGWGLGVAGLYWLASANCASDVGTCWNKRGPVIYVAWEAMYLTFMLIGSAMYAHYRGRLRAPAAFALMLALFGCFAVSFYLSPLIGAATHFVTAYCWGLVIFGCFYLLRDRFRLTTVFRFLADISYPLYVVHPLVGYATMRFAMAFGAPYVISLGLAIVLVVGLATLIHRYVEKPAIRYGARVARRLSQSAPRRQVITQ